MKKEKGFPGENLNSPPISTFLFFCILLALLLLLAINSIKRTSDSVQLSLPVLCVEQTESGYRLAQ